MLLATVCQRVLSKCGSGDRGFNRGKSESHYPSTVGASTTIVFWNLVKEFATFSSRWEILDWYHLKENLYKVGGSLKRLKQAEALLWEGQVEAVRTLFTNCRLKQAKNFCAYLEQHRQRIVNYSYYHSEQLCSVGSGAVESAIKQIGSRLKISGAQWRAENVNQVLSVRCAYLNGLLAL